MTSYIQLLNKIEAFCNAHYQIQRYGGEFREQMPNLSTESEKYPIVFVTPTGGTPLYDTNQISLDIYCVDIIQKNRANINTIVSDCHLILTDLYGYFSQGSDLSVDVIGQPSQTPLNNLDLDYVAGWMMTIVFEVNGYCVEAIPMGVIPSGGGDCADATYTVEYADGTPIESGTIESGGSVTVVVPDCPTCQDANWTLTDSDGNVLDSGTIPSGGSETIVAPDATYSNSDNSYSGSVLSGGSLSIPDSQINVNGVDQGDVVSVQAIDVNVTDGVNPVNPTDVSLVGNTLTIEVPACGPSAPIGATLMKTGMVTSNQTDDDADDPQGRDNDFFILGGNTPLGNNRRFSDELLNTSDSTTYYNSAGTPIAASAAYVNQVLIDWSTFNGTTYLMYYFGEMDGTVRNFTDYLSWCAGLSILGHTDWKAVNDNELFNLKNPSRQGVTNYPPMSKKGVFASTFWSNTSHTSTPTSAYVMVNYGGNTQQQAKTLTSRCIACRRGTLAEIGL
jgi:hypothetical protein